MKKIAFYLISFLFLISCSPNKKVAEATTEVQQIIEDETEATPNSKDYTLSKGTIHWVGSKVGSYDHRGTVNVQAGTIQAVGNKILNGQFIIDMTSIRNLDLPKEPKSKLEGHLKSADFFDVDIFKKAVFGIKSVEAKEMEESNYLINGILTLKGISKDVTFPALVVVKDGVLNAISDKFTIDRTNWEIKYASSASGIAKDKIINDNIQIQIEIEAK